MRAVACTLLVLGLLCDNASGEVTINSLRVAAEAWDGELPCRTWDCECVFNHQRGCCCASHELEEVKDEMLVKVMDLSRSVAQLGGSLLEFLGGTRVAFTASMSFTANCFGPFTRNSSIPFDVVTLNHGRGYNPTLGIFTAPRSGLYSFSFSVYSKVGGDGTRIYYKMQLMKNGEVVASTWEDNRDDSEDSSTQTVLLPLQRGGQVYVELLSGRQLCGNIKGLNTFAGSLIHPTLA